MMCTDIRIVVSGHSFVGHLKRFLEEDNDTLNRYQDGFNLYRENAETFFVYRPGSDLNFLKNVLRTVILSKRPHLVILQIGSNDLTKRKTQPTHLADEVLKFSQSLIKGETKFVIISAVIHRMKVNTNISVAEYNERVDQYNNVLSKACQNVPNVIFWHQRRIDRGNNLLKGDGVHLNNAGNYHLFMAYKNSLVHAIWHINRMEGCTCNTALLPIRQRPHKR